MFEQKNRSFFCCGSFNRSGGYLPSSFSAPSPPPRDNKDTPPASPAPLPLPVQDLETKDHDEGEKGDLHHQHQLYDPRHSSSPSHSHRCESSRDHFQTSDTPCMITVLILSQKPPDTPCQSVVFTSSKPEVFLKVHKIENFFDSDFGICVISLLVMSKY